MLWKYYTQYANKFEKLSSGHRTGKDVFIPIPKKGNAKECSNYHTVALISHVSKWKLLSSVQLFATPWTIESMEFSRPEYWSGLPFPSPGDLPNPGTEPRSPTWQVDSLPAEPQEKPKNLGVGSLSLLQGIFPNQESNRGLLHCRQILCHLSHQGSPFFTYVPAIKCICT